MLKLDYLKDMLIISMALSTIACAFIQKTKCHFNTSKFLPLYSFAVNIVCRLLLSKPLAVNPIPIASYDNIVNSLYKLSNSCIAVFAFNSE